MQVHHFVFLFLPKLISSYEECSGEFCPPTIPKQKTLEYKNGLGPMVGWDPVSGCYCREKVEEFALFYGRNHCTFLPKIFPVRSKNMKVTNTHIRVLERGDFDFVSQVEDLQIEGNYDLERIRNGTFRKLASLKNLSIAFNIKLRYLETDSFTGLVSLEQLFLNNNGFDTVYEIAKALPWTEIPNLLTLRMDSNKFSKVLKSDFEIMRNSSVQEISMNLCRIDTFHPQALQPLRKLQKLHIGENSLNINALTEMINTTIVSGIDLKLLDLFYMGLKKTPPLSLMMVIASSNISFLSLAKNQFEFINRNSFPVMPNLNFLDLREVLAVQVEEDAFANLPNLKTLMLSGNKLLEIPKAVLQLQSLTFLDLQQNSPGQSFHVYFGIRHVASANMTSLMYLNLGFNGLAHLFDSSFKGVSNVRVLILKDSSVFHIEKNTFSPLSELRVLNLMNNPMVHNDAVPDVFGSLTKLEVLLLSGCRFKYIALKNNPFRNLQSLKFLSLSGNFLKTVSAGDINVLPTLAHLDLFNNSISSWDQRMFSSNSTIKRLILSKNKLTDITVAMLDDFATVQSVDLDQNTILCKCLGTYNAYKAWRLSNNDVNSSIFNPPVYCGYPDKLSDVPITSFLIKPQYGKTICSFRPDKLFLLLPLVLTIFVAGLIGFVGFWYRWHIKYWIFLSKLYLSRKGKIKPGQSKKGYTNYQYDAFVSYSTEDRDFVVKLIEMMETYEPYLRLCVYERDFEIGTIISESVLESVAKSRKTVLVISDNYAKSQWCRWESQICEHHRLFFENEDGEYVDDSLILVRLSPVSDTYLTPTLKYLLKTRIYLQWTLDEKKQVSFWNKLRCTLGGKEEVTHM